MSRKGEGGRSFEKDVPWRAKGPTTPKIHINPILRVSQTPFTTHAISVMKHPNPIGSGLGTEAIVEAAGPDCLVPGLVPPFRLLGIQVWPIEVDFKFLEPVGRELKSIGRFLDGASDLMNKSFDDDR